MDLIFDILILIYAVFFRNQKEKPEIPKPSVLESLIGGISGLAMAEAAHFVLTVLMPGYPEFWGLVIDGVIIGVLGVIGGVIGCDIGSRIRDGRLSATIRGALGGLIIYGLMCVGIYIFLASITM